MPSWNIGTGCGCGCGGCASFGVECYCCGNFNFVQGDDASTRFFNYELSCPVCGMAWRGYGTSTQVSSDCTSPHGNTGIYEFSSETPAYRYVGSDGLWRFSQDLALAQYLADGRSIEDSCGEIIQ